MNINRVKTLSDGSILTAAHWNALEDRVSDNDAELDARLSELDTRLSTLNRFTAPPLAIHHGLNPNNVEYAYHASFQCGAVIIHGQATNTYIPLVSFDPGRRLQKISVYARGGSTYTYWLTAGYIKDPTHLNFDDAFIPMTGWHVGVLRDAPFAEYALAGTELWDFGDNHAYYLRIRTGGTVDTPWAGTKPIVSRITVTTV